MSTKQTRQISPFDKTQADITAHNEVAILNALKDYLAKKYNTNFANIKANLDAIKNALNGLSSITQHLGIPHEPSATPPPNPNEFDWYFDTAHNQFKMYHNSAWVMIADLANLINLDAKYLQITDAARDYLPRNDFQTALNLKADKSNTYTSSVIDGKLDLKQTKLTTDQQAVVDAQPFTADEKRTLANALTASSGDITNLSSQVTTNTADIASNKAAIATKQATITGTPLSVLQANPFTDEYKGKVDTALQQADISDVLRTGDVYSNSQIDQKITGAKGQFETGTLKELNDLENGVGVTNSANKVLTLPEVKGLEEHRNDITRQTLANFVDRVIFKDSNTLEYYDTILDVEVKDAAAVTSGNIMTLTNKLDVYGRIYVEGTSFGAVFKVPCAVEYNFLDKDKGVKFYGTKDQTYKWELFGKYEGDKRVNWIRFSGTSTMSITNNPGVASPTWTIQPMPYEVKMSDIFDKDHKLALIKLDYDVLPADGDHILNLEYLTTLPFVEARFSGILSNLKDAITNAAPNFTPEQQAVLAGNAFTGFYKTQLDNAPDNINTALSGKLDVTTYNSDKTSFLTSSDISGKADTSYVNTELGKKQNTLTDQDKLAIAKLYFTETLKTKYDGYETSKADATATTTALGLKANKTDVTNSLALKQDKLSTEQLALLETGAIKYTQAVDDRITANHSDIVLLKGKGAFLGKFADASARDTALAGTTLVNGDYVIMGNPAVRYVYDLRTTSWIEDISHSAAISSITLLDVAGAQDPKIDVAKREAITAANTHSDGAIATLTTTVNGKQDAIDAGKLALLDGAVKYTQADKNLLGTALQSHQDISGKANTSWVTTELNKKQNNLSDDQKAVINAQPFTQDEKIKLSGLTALTKDNVLNKLNLHQDQLDILKRTKEFTQAEKTKLASAITSHQNISGKADSTWVTSQLNSKFTQNSAKLVVNDTGVNPGDAKIGHGYKGIQSYGEGGSVQYYGKDAVNTVSLGQGANSEITIGKDATGTLMVGSADSTIAANNQKLIHGSKSASFSSIIDVAGGNVFTNAYKSKLDTALQPSSITGKVDASTMNNALAGKQDKLGQSELNVLAGHPYTTTDQGKVASALQPAALNSYYTSSQIDTKLNTKKDTFSDNLLLKSGSSASTAKFLTNTRYHTQSYLDDAGAYVGAFNANETEYATVKLIGEEPALFGHDSTKKYVIKFKDIQTKLTSDQLAVADANAFTNTYKTKLDNTASQAEIAPLAKKDLSNVVTTQEKAAFISNLQRIGVQVSLFNEFKGVLPSDPVGPHNDLDWYINDTSYEIKVWHQNAWHSVGKPTHTLSNAEVLTALSLTQTDITNLKYITNVRTTLSSIISKGNEISHLPANTVTALNNKADKATTYTRVDIDGKLNNIKQAAINEATSQAATSATTSINNAVSGKVNTGDVYTRTQSDGRYATKTELAGKQDNIDSHRLLASGTNDGTTAVIRANGNYKAQAYVYNGGAYVGAVNGGRLAVMKMDGNIPKIVYNADGSHSKEIVLDALKTKIDSITTSAIANAKLDHSLYALKSELSAAVDLDNTLKFIDTKIFSGVGYTSEVVLPNNTRIYDNFVIEGTDGIIGTTEVNVNNSLRGWRTLGRLKPGSYGASATFDVMGYYENDGGISKLKPGVGGAGVWSSWAYTRDRFKIKALATQAKGMGEAINDFVVSKTGNVVADVTNLKTDVSNIKTDAITVRNDVSTLKTQVSSLSTSGHTKRLEFWYNSGNHETIEFKVGS